MGDRQMARNFIVCVLFLLKEITLKGSLKGFTDLTNPHLKQHMEAAINISVDDLKASFGGLLKYESVQTPVESFRMLNPDTWPEDQASLLTFGVDGAADLVRHFKESPGR